MPRVVRGGLIQATLCEPATSQVGKIKQAMIDKHVELIAQAADQGAQVTCLQELFYGPYFCAEQEVKWYELTEKIPDGPTTKLMQELAKQHQMVIVVPMYEEDLPGVYYGMRRHADGIPDERTGENTAISSAYWLEAVPAFHTTTSGEVVGHPVGSGPRFSGTASPR